MQINDLLLSFVLVGFPPFHSLLLFFSIQHLNFDIQNDVYNLERNLELTLSTFLYFVTSCKDNSWDHSLIHYQKI